MSSELHGEAVRSLRDWAAPSAGQRALRESYLGFLDACPQATRRSSQAGHLTASALVLSPDGRHTCMVHHRIVGAWLQPGGHLEDDADLPSAALREAREETGLDGLAVDPAPLHLDCHPITCRGSGPTRHFDVRFLVTAPMAPPVTSEESHDVRWWPVDALPDVFVEVRELVTLGTARLRGQLAPAPERLPTEPRPAPPRPPSPRDDL